MVAPTVLGDEYEPQPIEFFALTLATNSLFNGKFQGAPLNSVIGIIQ